MSFREFFTSESGAVATDWVVLTAGITGLGIATSGVVTGGIGDVSGDIAATLSGVEIMDAFPEPFEAVQLAATDFAGGLRGAWSGGLVGDAGGQLGELLMVGQGASLAELALDVPAGAAQAVFTFDLIGGDSIDREPATIMINDTPVSVATGDFGQISFANANVPGISVTTDVRSQGSQLGGNGTEGWNESITTVSITVDDPGDSVTLGVQSATDQAMSDEFYGIDNVVAEAR